MLAANAGLFVDLIVPADHMDGIARTLGHAHIAVDAGVINPYKFTGLNWLVFLRHQLSLGEF